MASITIHDVDDALQSKLVTRASRHGRTVEEEAREILRVAVGSETSASLNLAAAIRRHIEPLGGVDLMLPARRAGRRPPELT